jgi:hypothetical protein
MQDPASELRRIPLPGTWVNKGKKRKGAKAKHPDSLLAYGSIASHGARDKVSATLCRRD